MALGIAVGVAVVGQPLTAGEALSSYRVAWVLSALMLFGVSVVFLLAYPPAPSPEPAPERRGRQPVSEPPRPPRRRRYGWTPPSTVNSWPVQ